MSSAIGKGNPNPQKTLVAPLGLSELDRLRAHISGCWEPPVGAKGADQLKVDIQVELEKDGTVKLAEIADRAAMALMCSIVQLQMRHGGLC